MPDYPEDAITAGVRAATAYWNEPESMTEEIRESVVAVLNAAAPLLADACAQAVLAHAERQHPRDHNHVPTAWDRHFSIAARVAAGAFTTGAEMRQQAADALASGNFVACPSPEDGT